MIVAMILLPCHYLYWGFPPLILLTYVPELVKNCHPNLLATRNEITLIVETLWMCVDIAVRRCLAATTTSMMVNGLWLMVDVEIDRRVQDRQGAGEGPQIQDDDDGHLIYQAGDILQARCTHIFVTFSLGYYFYTRHTHTAHIEKNNHFHFFSFWNQCMTIPV